MDRSHRRHGAAAAFAVLLGLAAACSADDPATVNLMIENFKFVPDPITISVTFDTAGTFPYFCGAHPEMVGTVIVEPAS